jgi:hypothetical protein
MKYGFAILILVVTALFFLLNSPPAEAEEINDRKDIQKAAKSLRKALIQALVAGERDAWKETSRTRVRELLLIDALVHGDPRQFHFHFSK